MIKMKRVYVQAIAVAILPPIWAALSTMFGFTTGAVALMTAGLVMISRDSGLALSVGLLIGDIWGAVSFSLIALAPPSLNILAQVIVLAIFGFLAVIINYYLRKVNMVSWFIGWALTIQILSMTPKSKWPITVLMIGVSMLVGIYYIGYGIRYIMSRFG